MYKCILLYSSLLYFFLIFLIYVFVQWKFKILNKKHISQCNMYNIKKYGKSGDVILTSYTNSCGIIKIFTNSKWTHTSMLYRNDNDELFILECGSYKSEKYCGVNLIPFKIWLKINKNSPITWIPIKKSISNNKLHYIYQKYKKSKFDGKIYKLISALKNNEYDESEPESFFCSQFIMTVLQKTNSIEKIHKPCSYSPNDFYIQKHEHIEKVFNKPVHLNPKSF